ncbi:hypothetical protein K503DRAFT_807022 [Rhizopogon vinicolor AM-OR11-026]|uniref:Uncharacterized protein n=1 Tax=Rhizopogon vinicolor AM-OR11-026 TaxID=1314800 RepID=A0A1B7MDC0_9AGAM|nr:hypothetical protein K503DRAFT_807022 [Rhizopogon vinicolor AM-OR11-026]
MRDTKEDRGSLLQVPVHTIFAVHELNEISSLDLEDTLLNGQEGDIEGSSTKIENEDMSDGRRVVEEGWAVGGPLTEGWRATSSIKHSASENVT